MICISQSSVIVNQEALTEEFLPEQVIHRMDQLKIIAQAIEPLFLGHTAKTVLMFGSSGSGKTTSARHLIEKLREDHRALSVYVNCWKNYSKFHFLMTICKKLRLNTHLGNISSIDLLNKIEKACMENPCVIVVDEFDRLEEKDELYSLREFGAALILVTSDERHLFRLKSRIESRLGVLEKVRFPPYKWTELSDIIEGRARLALRPESWNKEQIKRIALVCGGNAHFALESLKLAAERAEEKNASKILDEHIDFAIGNARRRKVHSDVCLNRHEARLLELIKKHKEIPSGDLHRKFREESDEPVSERTLRNYLHRMERNGLIRMRGAGRWRVYGVG
jgi:Cdc6-like AAA superfamily ATPase